MHTSSLLLLGLPSAALAALGLAHATPSGNTAPAAPAGETATPAGLVFGDVDGDGLDDAFVVSAEGQARLLMNFGEGRFEDVTLAANLAELGGATCALFADLDGDGRVDLFAGSSEHRLWKNLGNGTFEPMASGIEHDLVDLAAQAVDRDQDGRLDLQIHTEAGDLVYRNLGEGRFERLALPLGDLPQAPSHVGWIAPDSVDATDPLAAPDAGTPAERRLGRWVQGRAVGGFASAATSAPAGTSSFGTPLPFIASCQPGVRDANGGACIGASSVPTLGKLYPLSSNLFVAVGGNVGVGTTTPAEKLDVVGNARVSGTVTGLQGTFGLLSSSGGYHTTVSGGSDNSAAGAFATVSGGWFNTASGTVATVSGGRDNTASGNYSSTVSGGRSNTASYSYSTVSGGNSNTASNYNSTVSGGSSNTASGYYSTVSGGLFNTASGDYSTVSGGVSNTASANFSFAAGRFAKANHNGSFVWGDSAFVNKTSSANDEFNIYAEGGTRVFAVGQTTPSLVVAPGGNVGIGTSSPDPDFALDIENVGAGVTWKGSIAAGGASGQKVVLGEHGGVAAIGGHNGALNTWTNLSINPGGGNVGIGTTTPGFKLEVLGSAHRVDNSSTWTVTSDERLKKNVHDLEGALETLLALRGVTFEYEDPARGAGLRRGFIAQEVEKVLPEWVEEGEDGYKRLTVNGFEALAVEALREQEQKIEAQRDEIASLRSRVAELESLHTEIETLKTSLAALAAR